jgi:hypothetical protein
MPLLLHVDPDPVTRTVLLDELGLELMVLFELKTSPPLDMVRELLVPEEPTEMSLFKIDPAPVTRAQLLEECVELPISTPSALAIPT